MGRSKIAITIDADTLVKIDQLISNQVFANRSCIIEIALKEKLESMARNRLADESAKLDSTYEKKFAEEFLEELNEWPEY